MLDRGTQNEARVFKSLKCECAVRLVEHREFTLIHDSGCGDLSFVESDPFDRVIARAFDGKVESMMVDSQDGANQIQHRHWDKGASHEWGSHIPTICANVSLRQSRPVIPVRKLLSCSTWL